MFCPRNQRPPPPPHHGRSHVARDAASADHRSRVMSRPRRRLELLVRHRISGFSYWDEDWHTHRDFEGCEAVERAHGGRICRGPQLYLTRARLAHRLSSPPEGDSVLFVEVGIRAVRSILTLDDRRRGWRRGWWRGDLEVRHDRVHLLVQVRHVLLHFVHHVDLLLGALNVA